MSVHLAIAVVFVHVIRAIMPLLRKSSTLNFVFPKSLSQSTQNFIQLTYVAVHGQISANVKNDINTFNGIALPHLRELQRDRVIFLL
jgi:hypothetical protein